MATLSSVLAWRIPWTEEPGGPQSMGSQSQTRLKRLGTQNKHKELKRILVHALAKGDIQLSWPKSRLPCLAPCIAVPNYCWESCC